MIYSIVGLGKLGASMAAGIASMGYNVIGTDIMEKNIKAINKGEAPVEETDLDRTIKENKERLYATPSYDYLIKNSDVTFVIVPTPSNSNGGFSIDSAKVAFKAIGRALMNKRSYHLVVLTSTVLPGSTRYGLIPILEKYSTKKCGKSFGVCYSPEFIALGSVIHDFLNPDFNLVGEFDEKSGDVLQSAYEEIMANKPPCKRMSIENAELTKIALNTFITTKITFANMLSEIASNIPGGDIDIITDALGTDKRIGKRYLKGGMGYGGPCFPRDNIALTYFANELETDVELASTTDKINRRSTVLIGNKIKKELKGGVIGILGLSYKPDTCVIEESQALALANILQEEGFDVIGYDPLANNNAKAVLKDNITIVNSAKECIEKSTGVIIATPDKEFEDIDIELFKGKFVYDCWRLLRKKLSNVGDVDYNALGVEKDFPYNQFRLKKLWGSKYDRY